MKTILFPMLGLAILVASCSKSNQATPNATHCPVKGRWIHPLGTSLYEFTDSLRYTIYSTNGQFGSIATAIPNPNKWWMEGDTLVVDLNSGNFSRTAVSFECNCNLMKLDGSHNQTTWTSRFWKEGADSTRCQ